MALRSWLHELLMFFARQLRVTTDGLAPTGEVRRPYAMHLQGRYSPAHSAGPYIWPLDVQLPDVIGRWGGTESEVLFLAVPYAALFACVRPSWRKEGRGLRISLFKDVEQRNRRDVSTRFLPWARIHSFTRVKTVDP